MKYPQIISKLCREPWLIRESAHDAMFAALEAHMAGRPAQMMWDEDEEPSQKQDERYSEVVTAGGVMAVIRVHGILGKHLSRMDMSCGGCSLDDLQAMLKTADKSARVTKILLCFNTPGGTVMGTPETAELIADIDTRKPVIGFTDADCCSGGLYLASQCRRLYSTETAEIGSVGVRMVLWDLTKALDAAGEKVNAIASGKYKLAGAYFKPLTDDEREMFQSESDRIYDKFKRAVVSVRTVEDKYLQGQIFAGDIAAELGFTDGLVSDLDECMELESSVSE